MEKRSGTGVWWRDLRGTPLVELFETLLIIQSMQRVTFLTYERERQIDETNKDSMLGWWGRIRLLCPTRVIHVILSAPSLPQSGT